MVLLALQAAPLSPDAFPVVNTPILEYVQVFVVLGGVLAFAYLILKFALPRFFGLRTNANGPIQTVARYPLEPRKTLYLVKTGAQVFLIGTSEGKMECLTEIAAENAMEILASVHRKEIGRRDFRQVLHWVHKAGKADC